MRKRFFASLFVICLLCGTALAADTPTVTQTGMAAFSYYGTMSIGIYAELLNTGGYPITHDTGFAGIYGEDGNCIASGERVYCYPSVLMPGATGYAYAVLPLDGASADDVWEYRITVTGKETSGEIVPYKAVGAMEILESENWTNHYLAAEISNETADQPYGVYCVYALKDADGTLLYADMLNAYMLAIPANGSVFLRTIVPDGLIAYLEANDITPASVEAIAYGTP